MQRRAGEYTNPLPTQKPKQLPQVSMVQREGSTMTYYSEVVDAAKLNKLSATWRQHMSVLGVAGRTRSPDGSDSPREELGNQGTGELENGASLL